MSAVMPPTYSVVMALSSGASPTIPFTGIGTSAPALRHAADALLALRMIFSATGSFTPW